MSIRGWKLRPEEPRKIPDFRHVILNLIQGPEGSSAQGISPKSAIPLAKRFWQSRLPASWRAELVANFVRLVRNDSSRDFSGWNSTFSGKRAQPLIRIARPDLCRIVLHRIRDHRLLHSLHET